jgi:hypothetical protein
MEEWRHQGRRGTSIGTSRGRTMCGQQSVLVGTFRAKNGRANRIFKEQEDNAIASLDSYRRKWLNKKQRKKDERGCA